MEKYEAIHIEKKESFYKDLFKLNQEIMLLINPETFRIEDCNLKACSYYGYTYNEMIALKITHFNNLPEDQVLKEIMLAKSQQRNRFYFKHQLANGEIRDVEVHATPVNLEGRDVLLSIITDTTESKIINNRLWEENILLEKTVAERTYKLEEVNASLLKAKTELDQEIKFTEALFESIPGYLYVYDEAGKLIKWNKKHEEMTGYSSEELAEKTMDQWFEGEDAIRVAAAVEEVYRTGYGEVEAQLLIKGGEKLLIRSNGVRLIMDGKTYFTGVGIDVTERNKLETIIVNEKNLLETTLKSVGDGVISCDNDGNVVFLNTVAEGLTGWTQEMARGESIEKVFNIINEFTRIKRETQPGRMA